MFKPRLAVNIQNLLLLRGSDELATESLDWSLIVRALSSSRPGCSSLQILISIWNKELTKALKLINIHLCN